MMRYMGKSNFWITGLNMQVFNLPNNLTIFRLLLIPFLVIFFYMPGTWSNLVTATIFALAAITDYLDGYLARKLEQESAFGEFLDPVADKLIVVVALVFLVQSHATALLAIPAAIIICREITISALREWMAELGKRANVSVSYLGKLKTACQMLAIVLLLSQKDSSGSLLTIAGYCTLYLSSFLTIWSMVIYLKTAWSELVENKT